MAKTPLTSAAPYCSAEAFFDYHDAEAVADLLRDKDAPRPVLAALKTTATALGSKLNRFLLAATGEIESAALEGKRYTPTDLAALTGSAKEFLVRLTADVAFWRLSRRRQPLSADSKRVPGADDVEETLQKLKDGQRIFGFVESADAGLDKAIQSRIEEQPTGDPNPVTHRAKSFFGTHGQPSPWPTN